LDDGIRDKGSYPVRYQAFYRRSSTMPMLFVACRACHAEFPSGVAPTEETAGVVALMNVLAKCPRCGAVSAYNTHEFHFAGPAPSGGVAVPPGNAEALDRSREDHSAAASMDAPVGDAPAKPSRGRTGNG
jgi:hypothetical protein